MTWRAVAVLACLAQPCAAADLPGGSCLPAIEGAEAAFRLPARLLGSIALIESGRADPGTGRIVPWPWTINVAGSGRFFETKAEAILAVQQAQASGIRSIDVGCMQVNLLHHPTAFASLDQAFDPAANAAYAAGFLQRLFATAGGWPAAAAAYHSQTPGVADDYARRVMATWPLAAQFGAPGRLPPAMAAPIDPRGIYTPAFRQRLMQDAADRRARVAMGLVPAAPSRPRMLTAGLRVPGPQHD